MGKIVVLDNGHGGMINNIYQTAGKRSPNWSKGILYEGMFNRWVINSVIQELDRLKIPYFHISPEIKDVSLHTRAKRANEIYSNNPDTYLLSVHANAGGGEGLEGFTTKGYTTSDEIAEIFLSNLENDLLEEKMRFDFSDGDKDKESNFYILRKPFMPSFLVECGFMDTKYDYDNLWSRKYLKLIVDSLVKSIKYLYEN